MYELISWKKKRTKHKTLVHDIDLPLDLLAVPQLKAKIKEMFAALMSYNSR